MVCLQRFFDMVIAVSVIASVSLAWFLAQLIIKKYSSPSAPSSSPTGAGATLPLPDKTLQDTRTNMAVIARRAGPRRQEPGQGILHATNHTVEALIAPERESTIITITPPRGTYPVVRVDLAQEDGDAFPRRLG